MDCLPLLFILFVFNIQVEVHNNRYIHHERSWWDLKDKMRGYGVDATGTDGRVNRICTFGLHSVL